MIDDRPLTAEQRARFAADGFVVLPELASAEELDLLRPAADTILGGRIRKAIERRGGDRSFMGTGETLWVRLDPLEATLLAQFPSVRAARALAADLLEVDAETLDVGLRLFVKPPRRGMRMPFHQDEAHKDPAFDHRSVNVWIALDDADAAGGCMRYEVGSHRGEVRPHRAPEGLGGHVSLLTEVVDEDAVVDAPVKAGGACVHHCRTVHASHPNTNEGPRRALVAVIAAPTVKREAPQDWPWLPEGAVRYAGESF